MASITSTNGFILAGGKSRRMGQDKAMLKWGNGSLLEHIIHLLSTVAAPVRVVGRGEFLDTIPDKGPLGGILTALQTTDRVSNLFLALDLPLLTPDFLRMFHSRLLKSEKPLLACRVGGNIPLCLGIRPELTREVERRVLSDNLAVRSFVEESDPEVLNDEELRAQGVDLAMFANINTLQDWERIAGRP
jgi:molybdopterin-guanine dinucleotide biosynthesis protein A